MIVFDMENTLLQNRFIDICADHFKFRQALSLLRQIDNDPVSLTKRTALFLKDQKKSTLSGIAEDIPLIPDIIKVVQDLKIRSYTVGIITDSYQFVADIVNKKIGADFQLASDLQFLGNHVTGEVSIPSYFYRSPESTCRHTVCKTNALRHICKIHQVKLEQCIAVGDSDNDACMLEHVGMGVAFCSNSELARSAAKKLIEEPRSSELLTLAT